MPTDYDRIREENVREYGAGTRHLAFLGTLYPDRTHFLFELLQNAEDAGAKSLRFHLRRDRLELWHDGRPFTERDVRGLCGVGEGTKAEDLTQIGRFGIGFKSVYAYTTTPEIQSGEEHFRIEHFVRPFPVPPRSLGSAWTTLFAFPFDRPDMEPAQAHMEISRGLAALSARTLLFLRSIDAVEWIVDDGTRGCYLRDEKPVPAGRQVTTITQRDDQVVEEQQWIVFARQIPLPMSDRSTAVELAFQMRDGEKGEPASIRPMKGSPLVAFFPTEKETRLGFLIQGPYRTTPARDNVPIDDAWNRQLIEETATLVVDSLDHLKGMGLLTVSALEAMPIRPSDFPIGSMFSPIYRRVRTALQERPLLPGHARDCDFIRAEDARLARGTDLTGLFYPQQLGPLFGRERLYWLSTEISENRTPELFRYIAGFTGRLPGDGTAIEPLIKDVLVTPESIARRLSGTFMAKRVDAWVARLYTFLGKQQGVWGTLREKSFIRLEDGSHVAPFQPTGLPNAYLPISGDSEFPTVKREIVSVNEARKFLLDLGLKEPSPLSEVLDHILPKYARDKFSLPDNEHLTDVTKIISAIKGCTHDERINLLAKLRETLYILVTDKDGKRWYHRPHGAYVSSPEMKEYFRDNPLIYFVEEVYGDQFAEILYDIGVSKHVRIRRRESFSGIVTISASGTHKRGLHSFDPDCEIDGLDFALDNITVSKAAYIWNQLLMPNIHLISGVVESDTRMTYSSPNYRRIVQMSRMGNLATTKEWLPDREGTFSLPGELTLGELPDEFIRSEELAAALMMAPPEESTVSETRAQEEAAAETLGMSLDVVERIRENPQILERVLTLIEEEQAREQRRELSKNAATPKNYLKELSAAFDKPGKNTSPHSHDVSPGTLANPALRRDRIRDEIEESLRDEPTPERRFKRVETRDWEAKDNAVRIFLQEQYAGRCQICGETFQKRDGEPYFEGLYLVSQTHARWSGRSGNVICLCPTCCAKFLHGTVDGDGIIEQIRAIRLRLEGGTEQPSLRIRLCDGDVAIRFTEAHMLDLQEIIRLVEHEATTDQDQ